MIQSGDALEAEYSVLKGSAQAAPISSKALCTLEFKNGTLKNIEWK